jgi:hypothetical protein
MVHISVLEAQAWAESSKLPVSSVDANLEGQIVNLIFPRLSVGGFPITTWTNEASTPSLVRTIIAMYYIAALYDKHYAQEEEEASYANTLRSLADSNIAGLISGAIELAEYELPETDLIPSFFPNDLSSANEPTVDSPSDGGPAFMMGQVF